MIKIVKIHVEYEVELAINPDDEIVKEYSDEKELIDDLVSYRFSEVLPVLQRRGVVVKDISMEEWNHVED